MGRTLPRHGFVPIAGMRPETPLQKEAYVGAMFDSIANTYDLLNLVMTAGMLPLWHRAFARQTGLGPGGMALDVGCGTAELALVMARQVGPQGRVVGIDFSPAMLAVGRRKVADSPYAGRVTLMPANALALPFASDSFDCVSIGFVLRNVTDLGLALAEMVRVTRPGGRVISLEVSKPRNPLVRIPFYFYFFRVVPLLDRLVERRREARLAPYSYLPRSLVPFPGPEGLADMFRQAGLSDVRCLTLAGGVAAIHVGTKPAD